VPGGETFGYYCLKKTVSISSIVDTLEERKLSGVESSGGVEGRSKILDCHVNVSYHFAA
jgi:hypothetical protein